MFSRVYCLNLARRPDRWAQFQAGLPADWPFPTPQRYEAVDWKMAKPPDGYLGKGGWGCYRTHLRIWEDALCQGLESILVFEDDAIFAEPFVPRWQSFIEVLPPDWDGLYLGGQHLHTSRIPPVVVARNGDEQGCIRCKNVNRTHAYAMRRRMFDAAYRELVAMPDSKQENMHHIDHRLGQIHESNRFSIYAPWRFIVGQRAGVGDVNPRSQIEHWWNQFPIVEPEAVPCA